MSVKSSFIWLFKRFSLFFIMSFIVFIAYIVYVLSNDDLEMLDKYGCIRYEEAAFFHYGEATTTILNMNGIARLYNIPAIIRKDNFLCARADNGSGFQSGRYFHGFIAVKLMLPL